MARELADRLPASLRAGYEGPPPEGQNADQAVRDRCAALFAANQQQLSARGDAQGATASAFASRCRSFPMEFWTCIQRGDEGRADPECRSQFARLDREMREVRTAAREVAAPEQRVDLLANEQWETERDEVAPETIAPEEVVERPPPVVLE